MILFTKKSKKIITNIFIIFINNRSIKIYQTNGKDILQIFMKQFRCSYIAYQHLFNFYTKLSQKKYSYFPDYNILSFNESNLIKIQNCKLRFFHCIQLKNKWVDGGRCFQCTKRSVCLLKMQQGSERYVEKLCL